MAHYDGRPSEELEVTVHDLLQAAGRMRILSNKITNNYYNDIRFFGHYEDLRSLDSTTRDVVEEVRNMYGIVFANILDCEESE